MFGAVAVPAYVAFEYLTRNTVVALGTLFAEKQVLFDRYRGLESLIREVSLAETVARSPAVLEWARDESDPVKAARGLAELEHYRLSFKDRSYFVVFDGSGNYYFNDNADDAIGQPPSLSGRRDNPRDGWYFKTIATGSGLPPQRRPRRQSRGHQGLDQLRHCATRDRVLGVIGTGVDLSQFIREVVAIPQTGVTSMFVDRAGAVQAPSRPRAWSISTASPRTPRRRRRSSSNSTMSRPTPPTRRDDAARRRRRRRRSNSRFMRIDGHRVAGRRRLSRPARLVQRHADGRRRDHRSPPVPADRAAADGCRRRQSPW